MSNDLPLADRLARVHERIEAACRRRGDGPEVQLVGVSKRHPTPRMLEALAAGLRTFGENYAQELDHKRSALAGKSAAWHFIGPLQSNKAKLVTGIDLIHSVDRAKIIDALDRAHAAAIATAPRQQVLLQVNIAGEEGKAGVAPDKVEKLLAQFADTEHLACRGLMLIPPASSAEDARPHFKALRTLADRLRRVRRPFVELEHLSMGMSHDFEVAIEEGATLVRVGTAIFGPRPDA